MKEKITISGNKVECRGRHWDVLEASEGVVHLIDGADGICVECPDEALLKQLAAIARTPHGAGS